MSDLERTVENAVDYLLFVDEARIERVRGTSGFAEAFEALGPRDAMGRSLRQLQLEGRLLRYPLSYMIYSTAFDTLPATVPVALALLGAEAARALSERARARRPGASRSAAGSRARLRRAS